MRFRLHLSWVAILALLLAAGRPAIASVPDIAFEKYRLENGLDVILHPDHRVPIVHVEIWYKVGSKDEAPGKTGFAHLFEHMMFQGTKHIPEDAFFEYLSQAGASSRNGSTNMDRTNYYETLPASRLELALWLESSRMGFLLERPSFQETFANQREVVKNERRQRVENVPLGAAQRLELEAEFPPGHPYRHEVLGSMEDLDHASEGDLTDFYNRYYAPDNAVLLIAGDFDTAITKGLIDKYFAPITAGPAIERRPVPKSKTAPAERRLDMEAKINLPQGRMLWSTVPVFAPGDAEMDLLANILGKGKSSRLYQRLVYDLKSAQSVTVYHGSRELVGTFVIAYTAMPGKSLADIEKVIDEELEKLRTTPPTKEEVERARNQIKTDVLRGMEPLAGLASRLLYYQVYADDPGYLRRDLGRYDQATPEELQSWAKKILTKQGRVVTAVVPNPQAPIMGRLVKTPAEPKDAKAAKATAASVSTKKAKKDEKDEKIFPRTTPDAPFRARLPGASAQRRFKVPPVKRLRLRNGLQVILAESHKLPLVSVDLVVKTGSNANPRGKAGLAALTANMLDESTTKRTATQIADEIAQLGAKLDTYATFDASAVSLQTMTENLDRALPVWADVSLAPTFDETELARVTANQISALTQRKDRPPVVAYQVFARALWGDEHPFAWPDEGTTTSLRQLSRADLKKFYDTYYAPNNAVLVISGDLGEKDVRTKIEPLLAHWKAKKIPPVKVPKVEAPEKPRVVLVDKPGAPQSSIRLGLPAIDRKSPDYYRALVANDILGGVFKRLTMNLRETKGWTYGVRSQFDARRAIGQWTVSGEFVAAHTADAIMEIIKEIHKLRADDVTAKELTETKDEFIGAFPAKFATAGKLAGQMAALAVYGLPSNELDSFSTKIASVDKEAVKRMAYKYMKPDQLLIVVVGDRTSIEGSLRKVAEVERRDADGGLIEPVK